MKVSKGIDPPPAAISSRRWRYTRLACSLAASETPSSPAGVVAVSLALMSASNENLPLKDHVVLITGGARRVGAEMARAFHAAGATLMIHYRSSAAAAIALTDGFNKVRPHSAAHFAAHLSTPETPEKLIAATRLEFGRLDVLINNASSFYPT